MQLKDYQAKTVGLLSNYLQQLNTSISKGDRLAEMGLDVGYLWDREAWRQVRDEAFYQTRRNGIDEITPNVCLKVPTGGGKTLLAVKAVDAIRAIYRHGRTGLVLWIVPTSQIYRQTLQALRDRAHPYRQLLDISCGGRTLVLEKDAAFSPEDVQSNLVVMMLMLPSANRQNKETLRLFHDQGGFSAFFPPEDRLDEQAALLERVPNLDAYAYGSLLGRVPKTSLGNTLRLLRPIIILDEGHKAYSDAAQETLLSFNPAFILELSATPSVKSNVLVNISGQDLLREGMIKLDLHVHTKASMDWRDTMLAAHQHRKEIEQSAQAHEAETGTYIRPIVLIQVERTGAKQRQAGLIHAEDVREYLVTKLSVLPEEIAVKSSERDDIEGIDLLSRDCPIRFIITKQALQEGWDCPFAYIVVILGNADSTTAVTQLVGRVLRQPYARKTGEPVLDESHVYAFRAKTTKLLDSIRMGLVREGLGDVGSRVVATNDADVKGDQLVLPIRAEYEKFAGNVYLPCFVVPDHKRDWRPVGRETDILSRVNWGKVSVKAAETWPLNPAENADTVTRMGLTASALMLESTSVTPASDGPIDRVLMTRQLLDVVPNPWVAFEYVTEAVDRLLKLYSEVELRRNLGFVVQELKKELARQIKKQKHDVFTSMLKRGEMHFYLIKGAAGYGIPHRVRAAPGRKLTRATGDPLRRTLFDVFEDDLNETEKAVALYLDQQEDIVQWWFRNGWAPATWRIEGWENAVEPDFAFMRQDEPIVYIIETKGLHLKNEDTDYKKALFELCNDLCRPTPITLEQAAADHQVYFQVVFDDEWQRVLNEMLTRKP